MSGGLAEILAAAGNIYGGYNAAEQADIARRMAMQREQLGRLEVDRAQRAAAYDREVAGGLADFSADGPKASVVNVDTGTGPAVYDDGTTAPPVSTRPARAPNELGALEFRKQAALRAGMPEKADEIDRRMRAVKQEGLLETAQAILSGKDENEIRDTFNARGQTKLARVQRLPGSGSQIIGVTEDGRSIQFDAENMMRSLLTPKDWAADDRNKEVALAKEREQAWRGEAARARSESDRIRAEAYRDRPPAGRGAAAPDPAKERAERRRFNTEVTRFSKADATTTDPETGKAIVDNDMANGIAGLAILMSQDDPDLLADPRQATQLARDRLLQLREQAGAKADREWGSMAEASGMPVEDFAGVSMPGPGGAPGKEGKDAFVARRSREIVQQLLRRARAATGGESGSAAAPAPEAAAGGVPQGYTDTGKRTKNGNRILADAQGNKFVEE